jgi:hypothetical protein
MAEISSASICFNITASEVLSDFARLRKFSTTVMEVSTPKSAKINASSSSSNSSSSITLKALKTCSTPDMML